MKNEEIAEDICGRLCRSKDNKEYNAMYLACMEAMEWKDAQAVQDRVVIRKHWQRWAEEREEEMKNDFKDKLTDAFHSLGVTLLEYTPNKILEVSNDGYNKKI